jgi:hypothetical protein
MFLANVSCPSITRLYLAYSCQASAEHFQQSAEFPLLCNCRLGPFAVTVLSIPLARPSALAVLRLMISSKLVGWLAEAARG